MAGKRALHSPRRPSVLGRAVLAMAGRMIPLAVSIRRVDVLHFLGYPRLRPPGRPQLSGLLDDALAEASSLLCARGIFREFPVAAAREIGLPAEESKGLVVGLVTAGPEIEARASDLLRRGDATHALLLDACGSAAAEAAADRLCAFIVGDRCAAPSRVSCRVSPGYGDWPLTAQSKLFELLPHAELGVSLTPGLMMVPRKSISFAMWLGAASRPRAGHSGCSRCGLAECRYRRGGVRKAKETKESGS